MMAKRKTVRRAKKQTVTKIQQMVDYVIANPEATSREVCDKFGAHSSQYCTARKRAGLNGNGHSSTDPVGDLIKDVRTIKRMGVAQAKRALSVIETIQGG